MVVIIIPMRVTGLGTRMGVTVRRVVVHVNDVEHRDVVGHEEDVDTGGLCRLERVIEALFEIEAVGNDKVGVVDPFDVARRRFEIVRVLTVRNQHGHFGRVADELPYECSEHRVGDDDVGQVSVRGRGGRYCRIVGASGVGRRVNVGRRVVARAGEAE